MKIVASNSLTVSNVNDGTITHTAWSYSADGTDRFTTVYPNLNLLTDSKDFKNKNVAESASTTSITSPDSTIIKDSNDTYLKFLRPELKSQDWFRAYMIRGSLTYPNFPNVDVKPNTQYTFSVWLKGTGTHQIIAYNNWTSPNPTTLTVNLTDVWTKYVLTVNTSTTIPTQGAQFFIRSSTIGSEINLKKPKVEEGSTATPWMPSASEVTTADWPKYRGEYSDRSSEQSTNPSDYTWSLMRGNDGALDEEQVKEITDKIDTKADSELTQEQINALNEKNQILESEMQAKASMEAFSDLEKNYQSFVKSNADDQAKAEADLVEAGRRIELLTTQFGGLAELKTFIDTYMSSSNEGLIIGKNDASSTIKVSSDRISMFSAGKEVMYISQGVININNGIFAISVQIGKFRTEQYHLNADMNVIRYVGG